MCLTSGAYAEWSFTGLGILPGGDASVANATNVDGTVVVGSSTNAYGFESFVWTPTRGLVGIGTTDNFRFGAATGVNRAGTVVAGFSGAVLGYPEPYSWSNGRFTAPRQGLEGMASGVSERGLLFGTAELEPGFRVAACFLPNGRSLFTRRSEGQSAVTGVTYRIVNHEIVNEPGLSGWTEGPNGVEAASITGSGSNDALFATRMGDLPGGQHASAALGIAPSAQPLIGYGTSQEGPTAALFYQRSPFDFAIVPLGDLAGGDHWSMARGGSASAAIVVGSSRTAAGEEAFVWSGGSGMVNLRTLLLENGVEAVRNWRLTRANGISHDGTTVVGYGINPRGQIEAFRAKIAPRRWMLFFERSESSPYRVNLLSDDASVVEGHVENLGGRQLRLRRNENVSYTNVSPDGRFIGIYTYTLQGGDTEARYFAVDLDPFRDGPRRKLLLGIRDRWNPDYSLKFIGNRAEWILFQDYRIDKLVYRDMTTLQDTILDEGLLCGVDGEARHIFTSKIVSGSDDRQRRVVTKWTNFRPEVVFDQPVSSSVSWSVSAVNRAGTLMVVRRFVAPLSRIEYFLYDVDRRAIQRRLLTSASFQEVSMGEDGTLILIGDRVVRPGRSSVPIELFLREIGVPGLDRWSIQHPVLSRDGKTLVGVAVARNSGGPNYRFRLKF
jgi:uncharacterized membrane protein